MATANQRIKSLERELQQQYKLYAEAIKEHKAAMATQTAELVTIMRMIRVIKSTVNGITLIGEDERSPTTHHMVTVSGKNSYNG